MRIEGRYQERRSGLLKPARVSVMVEELPSGEGVVVLETGDGYMHFDGNHAEALETAIRAARLELEARSKARP